MTRLAKAIGRGCTWPRFGRAEGGVSTLEFALFAPAVFILVLGIIEVGLDLTVDASVQYAAQQASRAGITTVAPATGETRERAASQTVTNILRPWTNIGGRLTIAVVDYGTFGSSTTSSSSGGLGDVVSYNITLTMPHGFTGFLGFFGATPLVYRRYYLVQNEK
ncbi:TadE/TadG family type IV pilus assembly protein [Candidatus Burkholderia verschuerenii]|uniref:TadE/TadG family type IV pilus assembly protein n=1 Tax=Candidatus Burkholderia verschuerenii TaxID=242163 RepID=UPI00067DD161|nr:TadE/TadG family type IV pilus assembly protein [Candidatus Burkholderia verschuerenii]